MAKNTGNFPDNKDYYKAIVTVPLSMHIPFENNNSITIHSEMHNTEMDKNAISVFPKTTIDILMNNNSCETFAGFTTQQPLGFIVPPPLNQDNTMSDGPFQIVPNVDLFNSTFINTTSNDTNFGCYTPNYNEILSTNNTAPLVGFFQSTPIVPQNCQEFNARNNIPPTSNDMDTILNQSYNLTNTGNDPLFVTSLSQSSHFVTTSCQNVSSSNDQSNTTVTSNGLVFSTNCPIMSSIATTSLNCHTVNDSPFVTPSGFSTPPFKQHSDFRNNSANDSVSDLNSNVSETGAFKDSYFVCKTRKVIQQMTTVHNSEAKTVTNPCGCTCRCNQQNVKPSKETTSETFSSVSDRNSQNTKFRTEKSIELNYDYPKTYFQTNGNKDGAEVNDGSKDDVRNISSSQTFQTTTEVNSTLYLFERKKVTSRSKNAKFKRSNSAPVDIPSDEPIYATVNKLSKKLKRLNMKNLENEIKYVPPDEKTAKATKDTILEEKNEPNEEIKIEKNDTKTEKLEVISNNNGTNNKTVPKSDSFSESSDKTVGIQKNSGTIRKKKKFSIRFKRKSSKNSCNSKISIDCDKADDEKQENLANGVSKDKLVLDLINSVESDKLIDASSSPDSPEVKTNNMQPNYCQKHGKPKHHHHYKTGCPSPRCYREEYPQHRCGMQNKKSSVTQGDSGTKKHLHPSRNYYKQDSYQEMTTSHSERERTNSLSSSGHSGFSLGSKGRSGSQSRREGSIPWCGCWGNSCL